MPHADDCLVREGGPCDCGYEDVLAEEANAEFDPGLDDDLDDPGLDPEDEEALEHALPEEP